MDHATAGDNLEALRPGYGFTMTVAFSADTLARELAGVRNYDW